MADLKELIERVEKAEGPDFRLDGDIAIAFPDDDVYEWYVARDGEEMVVRKGAIVDPIVNVPCYTASLDAALALCERVLPGWRRTFREHDDVEGSGWFSALTSADYRSVQWQAGDVVSTDEVAGRRTTGDAPTPALAVLLALLRALEGGER